MRDDYQNAKKIGDKYKASALLKGKEPYLPSLETEMGPGPPADRIPLPAILCR